MHARIKIAVYYHRMGVVIIYVLYSRARNLGRHFVGQKCQVAVSSAPVDTVKRRKLSYFVFLENLNDWMPGLGQFDVINGCQMNTVAFRV